MRKTKTKKYEVTEEELLRTIEIITKKLAYKFKFGYHELSDMKQQISVFAIEGLEKYDHKRPLENFLWTHVRNRLFNFKRDNYQRPDKPCLTCPLFNRHCADTLSDCTEYRDKNDCELYYAWFKRNNTKKNLMYLNTIEEIKENLPNFKHKQTPEYQEMINFLDEVLIGEYRTIYLKIKYGTKVYKSEIQKLLYKIQELNHD